MEKPPELSEQADRKIVAGILNGFGLNVLAYENIPTRSLHLPIKLHIPISTLFYFVDIITLHCPLTPENKHIVNAAAIAKMKRGVMIINTAGES